MQTYYKARTELDLTACKQMAAHTVAGRNRLFFFLLLIVAVVMAVIIFFGSYRSYWVGLILPLVAFFWFFRTQHDGPALYDKLVTPSGRDYLVLEQTVDKTGLMSLDTATEERTKYGFNQVDNFARSKDYFLILLKDGTVFPMETAAIKGGSVESLENYLMDRCAALKEGVYSTGVRAFVGCVALSAVNIFMWLGDICLLIIFR